MTEAEWLTCGFGQRMYNVVRERATIRQVRLFMVACCRVQTAGGSDPRLLRAVDAAERCADDDTAEALLTAEWQQWLTRRPESGPRGEFGRIIADIWQLLDEYRTGRRYASVEHAVSHAVFLCLRELPQIVFTGGSGNAAEYCARAIECAASLRRGISLDGDELDEEECEPEMRRSIADLLRDLFGNPFRPVAFAPSWWTDTAVSLARQMYEGREFSAMPILADALQDAGCGNDDVLGHCRDPQAMHVRGCWVVDLVLGKS